jgi:hypothetical protein
MTRQLLRLAKGVIRPSGCREPPLDNPLLLQRTELRLVIAEA